MEDKILNEEYVMNNGKKFGEDLSFLCFLFDENAQYLEV
ncbi:Protein of unknown function [Bacillus wiedmannii]|uniref:Uncharacterized protein n=1 Tax=Bacillus wiedmannii TaxID=1890302 RepID=A0A1C4EF48_9BACI|nr:Protein of unknown function [Bacillus wiedmannii]